MRYAAAMRVVLYEWCLSGGLVADDAALAREGRVMLEALAADAAKDPALEVTALVADGRSLALPPTTRREAGGDVPALVAAARAADWTVVVAPESDGILARLVRVVREAGGRVLAPADRVIGIAADKQATVEALAARGVPVPAGRPLAAGEPVPGEFRMPAIRKRRDGCGGDGLDILATPHAPPADRPARLEAFARGTPVGVSCICGPRAIEALPPLRQRFTEGPRPRYLGGDPVTDGRVAARAASRAVAAVSALGADAGWVGVDMILGARPDGRDDRVLEVNPRITTSFVAQAGLLASSLVAAMIEAAMGGAVAPVPAARPAPAAGSFRLAAD